MKGKLNLVGLKGIGYVRVSTPDQKQSGSHKRQKMQIRDWEKKHGITLEYIYIDAGVSGWTLERKEFNKMLDHLKNVDYLVIQHTDRFSRADPAKTFILYDEILVRLQKRIFSIMEGEQKWDSLESQLIHFIKVYTHAKRSETDRKKIKHGLEKAREQGKTLGRPRKELNLKLWNELKDAPSMNLVRMADLQRISKPVLIARLKEAGLYKYPKENRIPPKARQHIIEKKERQGAK